jgi:hypothetical protein
MLQAIKAVLCAPSVSANVSASGAKQREIEKRLTLSDYSLDTHNALQ